MLSRVLIVAAMAILVTGCGRDPATTTDRNVRQPSTTTSTTPAVVPGSSGDACVVTESSKTVACHDVDGETTR